MSQEHLRQNLVQLVEAVDLCFERKFIMPTLALVYSGIDILGWLDGSDSESVRDRFTRWVDKYLLPAKPLGCTALDLYAARCGIVHTFTTDSDLALKGRADRVTYASGTSRADTWQRAMTMMGMRGWVVIKAEDLIGVFKLGLAKFLDEIAQDQVRAQNVYARAGKFLITLPSEEAQKMRRLTEEALGIPASEWERPPST